MGRRFPSGKAGDSRDRPARPARSRDFARRQRASIVTTAATVHADAVAPAMWGAVTGLQIGDDRGFDPASPASGRRIQALPPHRPQSHPMADEQPARFELPAAAGRPTHRSRSVLDDRSTMPASTSCAVPTASCSAPKAPTGNAICSPARSGIRDKFYEMLGLDRPADRRTVDSVIHPDDRPHSDAATRRRSTRSADCRPTFAIGTAMATTAGCESRAGSGPAPDGRAERLIGMAIDVDAEKRAQLALQRLTEQFDRAMEASQEVHFERSLDDDSFFMSPQINALLGHPPDRPPPTRDEFLALGPSRRPARTERELRPVPRPSPGRGTATTGCARPTAATAGSAPAAAPSDWPTVGSG